MYKFCDYIRVRNCDDMSFIINIKTNEIYMIKYDSYKFLKQKLEDGLNKTNLSSFSCEFCRFITILEENEILEVDENEN